MSIFKSFIRYDSVVQCWKSADVWREISLYIQSIQYSNRTIISAANEPTYSKTFLAFSVLLLFFIYFFVILFFLVSLVAYFAIEERTDSAVFAIYLIFNMKLINNNKK